MEREAAKQPSAEVDDDHADGPFSTIKTAQNSDPSTAGKVSRCGPGEVRRFNAARTAADAGAEDDAADDDDADADVPYFTLKQHRTLTPQLPEKSVAADPARSEDSRRQGDEEQRWRARSGTNWSGNSHWVRPALIM